MTQLYADWPSLLTLGKGFDQSAAAAGRESEGTTKVIAAMTLEGGGRLADGRASGTRAENRWRVSVVP